MTAGELIEVLQMFPTDARVEAVYGVRDWNVTDAGFDSTVNVVELIMGPVLRPPI
jgi:hypothetical protein